MVVKSQVRNGLLDDKENLLSDVSEAFKNGLYNDITFNMSDEVRISSNKFVLASRVPFFSTMLFGGLADNLSSNLVPLKCCDSTIFNQILKFVFEGEISFSDLNMQSLLDLLETARLFCIDSLVDGIVDYLNYLLECWKVDFKDCLVALDFTINHKFTAASELFLDFIDKNLSSISSLPEFNDLSESSVKMLLKYDRKISTEIERFEAFAKWLENKETIAVNVKNEMLSWFDLRKFEKYDLVRTVRKTNLFQDKEICDVLEEHLVKLEDMLHSKNVTIEEQRQVIEESNVVNVSLTEGHRFGMGSRTEFTIPLKFQSHYLNKVQFSAGRNNYLYSYNLECSQDGENWIRLAECLDREGGRQLLHFERNKMKFLAVKVFGGRKKFSDLRDNTPYLEDITVMMS